MSYLSTERSSSLAHILSTKFFVHPLQRKMAGNASIRRHRHSRKTTRQANSVSVDELRRPSGMTHEAEKDLQVELEKSAIDIWTFNQVFFLLSILEFMGSQCNLWLAFGR